MNKSTRAIAMSAHKRWVNTHTHTHADTVQMLEDDEGVAGRNRELGMGLRTKVIGCHRFVRAFTSIHGGGELSDGWWGGWASNEVTIRGGI
jgi:hypothetical protein